eukprot:6817795-Prymnesium_polylepis.1
MRAHTLIHHGLGGGRVKSSVRLDLLKYIIVFCPGVKIYKCHKSEELLEKFVTFRVGIRFVNDLYVQSRKSASPSQYRRKCRTTGCCAPPAPRSTAVPNGV